MFLFVFFLYRNIHYNQNPYLYAGLSGDYLVSEIYKVKHFHDPWNRGKFERIFWNFPKSTADIYVLVTPRFGPKLKGVGLKLYIDDKRVGAMHEIKRQPWYIIERRIPLEKGEHSFSLRFDFSKDLNLEEKKKLIKEIDKYGGFTKKDLWIYFKKHDQSRENKSI